MYNLPLRSVLVQQSMTSIKEGLSPNCGQKKPNSLSNACMHLPGFLIAGDETFVLVVLVSTDAELHGNDI